jgi:hypothetical protein
MCEFHLDAYRLAASKVEKSQIVTRIVDAVRDGGADEDKADGSAGHMVPGGFVARVRRGRGRARSDADANAAPTFRL